MKPVIDKTDPTQPYYVIARNMLRLYLSLARPASRYAIYKHLPPKEIQTRLEESARSLLCYQPQEHYLVAPTLAIKRYFFVLIMLNPQTNHIYDWHMFAWSGEAQRYLHSIIRTWEAYLRQNPIDPQDTPTRIRAFLELLPTITITSLHHLQTKKPKHTNNPTQTKTHNHT